MATQIIPLKREHQREVYHYLMSQEIWQLIPLDALLLYGLTNNKKQRWFAEVINGQLYGIIFQDDYLVHLAYQQLPPSTSALYPFITQMFPAFISYGRKEILQPIMTNLHYYGYQWLAVKENKFVKQSVETSKAALATYIDPGFIKIRNAHLYDLPAIHSLLQEYVHDQQLDFFLIEELVPLSRVKIACLHERVLGCIMILKETPHYALLGGLFVSPDARRLGVGSLLGQRLLIDFYYRGKEVCFYYDQKQLESFYHQGFFVPVGTWSSYSLVRVQ